jgi:hypothetical protein
VGAAIGVALRDQWRSVLDAEIKRWPAMPLGELISRSDAAPEVH